MFSNGVKKHISHPKHVSQGFAYVRRMTNKRRYPAETLTDNLNRLMEATKWSNRHLAQLCGVSDRYIGMIRRGDVKPTIEIAEQIAAPFGLTGWQLIMPNLDIDIARTGRLARLVENYQKAPPKSRDYIDSVAERDSDYGPDAA